MSEFDSDAEEYTRDSEKWKKFQNPSPDPFLYAGMMCLSFEKYRFVSSCFLP